uniref:Uncharacterized protein n=1 Tax=Microcebus murinus TaxID=30608 RepID=A0A8C5YGW6_MICMU
MATRKRCKLPRAGPDFENVIKRIGGDLTRGIINRGSLANAEQMGLQGSAHPGLLFFKDKKTEVRRRDGTDSIPVTGRSGLQTRPPDAPLGVFLTWNHREPRVSTALALAGLRTALNPELSHFLARNVPGMQKFSSIQHLYIEWLLVALSPLRGSQLMTMVLAACVT